MPGVAPWYQSVALYALIALFSMTIAHLSPSIIGRDQAAAAAALIKEMPPMGRADVVISADGAEVAFTDTGHTRIPHRSD